MWLSEKLGNENKMKKAEKADVTLWEKGNTEAMGSVQNRNFSTFAPYGYSCAIPQGETVLMIPSGAESACCGVLCKDNGEMAVGEIKISNVFGASIRLASNGSVIINGVVITADGIIIESTVKE